MRFQANPDGTILAQNYIVMLCEARGGLTVCCIILRSEIKVNSVHRILRAIFFLVQPVIHQKLKLTSVEIF
jgi:hypothetical protein